MTKYDVSGNLLYLLYKLKAGAERIFFFPSPKPTTSDLLFLHASISPFSLFNSLRLTCSHIDVSYLILCLNTFSNSCSSLSPSHLFNSLTSSSPQLIATPIFTSHLSCSLAIYSTLIVSSLSKKILGLIWRNRQWCAGRYGM